MLQYERINISEEIDINKTSASKNVCFVSIGTLKMLVINLNHMFVINVNVLMTAYELKNIAILNVKGVDYRCIPRGISKNEVVNILNNSVLEDKSIL